MGKKKGFTQSQINAVLAQAEAGTPIKDVVKRAGITQTTFFRWKKLHREHATKTSADSRKLAAENMELRAVVADLTLKIRALQNKI